MKKKLTVLMTTYNEKQDIFKKSLDSILNQTFSEFNIMIIIDNPNNEEIIKMIKKYSKIDKRINYFINTYNIGLAESLNVGISKINTKYIARMDSDDIAYRNRLEKQLKYAEKNNDIDFFGTNIYYIDNDGKKLYKRSDIPNDSDYIKESLKYVNIFNHPTFFGKTEVFKKIKYRNLTYAQDYDFSCRVIEAGYNVSNLNETLLYYRLPQKINEEKLILQRLSYQTIQFFYSQNKLSETNINEEINNRINKLDKDKYLKGIKFYDLAFSEKKHGHIFKFIKFIVICFFCTNYQKIQICNLIHFYFLKRRHKNV